jgi:hypothetical protein
MMQLLYMTYAANILVAGPIGILSLFYPEKAAVYTFSRAYPRTEVMRLVGSLWLAIAALSILGLWKPLVYAPVLLLQLMYKGSWLLRVALPAVYQRKEFPKAMAVFFLIWVFVLPFVIPWTCLK